MEATARLAPETVLDGYRVKRLLGKGGMAEVYAVESEKTGAPYALKLFVCGKANAANAIFLKKRFLSEGRLLARLNHPRLVRVYDFGYADPACEDAPYFVMDLVETALGNAAGAPPRPLTLRDALAAGITTEERIAGWYGDLVEALGYIHGRNVVHRDVSLENVLVGPDGRAVLSDFGVARILDRDLRAELDLSLVTLLKTGCGPATLGKTFYLAPELQAGDEATPAADYYALGVMVYFLLVQSWYVPGGKMDTVLAFADEQWQGILAGLLEKDPAARRCRPWRDPRETELENLRRREQTAVGERGVLVGRLRRRVRLWAGLTAFALALACGGAGWALVASRRADPGVAETEGIGARDRAFLERLCQLPAAHRSIGNRPYATAGTLMRSCVASRLREARRDPARDIAWEFEQEADRYRADVIENDEDLRNAFLLFHLQAAFHLYLRERAFPFAAAALEKIRDEDEEWADNLYANRAALLPVAADRAAFEREWKQRVEP